MAHHGHSNLSHRWPVLPTTRFGNRLCVGLLALASIIQAFLLVLRALLVWLMPKAYQAGADRQTESQLANRSWEKFKCPPWVHLPVGAAAGAIKASLYLNWGLRRSHDPPRPKSIHRQNVDAHASAGALARDGPMGFIGRGAARPGRAWLRYGRRRWVICLGFGQSLFWPGGRCASGIP